jgi:hypothetical protein
MNRSIPTAILAVAAWAAPVPLAGADSGRFDASAEVHPLGRSADGRFTASGEVRVQPAAASADGRFVLKATNVPSVGCEPFADELFANGFEP